MEIKKDDQKYQAWYESMGIPIQTVRKFGNSYGITIPKKTIDKYDLAGKKVFPIILRRKRKMFGEMKDGEKWVRLNKREMVILKKAQEEEKSEEGGVDGSN